VCKKCIISLILFSLVGSPLFLSFIAQADAHIISGTVYTGDPAEGAGTMGITRTVRIKVNGAGDFTDTTDGSGEYSIDVGATAAGDILTVFIDDETEDGATVTLASGSDISDLDIYQNHIIVRSDNGSQLRIEHIDQYDFDDDEDIIASADTSGSPFTLDVYADVFYIWPGTTFYPVYLDSSTITLENIKILGTYDYTWTFPTTYVSGNWINQGTFKTWEWTIII
jgi:hypothetical protein